MGGVNVWWRCCLGKNGRVFRAVMCTTNRPTPRADVVPSVVVVITVITVFCFLLVEPRGGGRGTLGGVLTTLGMNSRITAVNNVRNGVFGIGTSLFMIRSNINGGGSAVAISENSITEFLGRTPRGGRTGILSTPRRARRWCGRTPGRVFWRSVV